MSKKPTFLLAIQQGSALGSLCKCNNFILQYTTNLKLFFNFDMLILQSNGE